MIFSHQFQLLFTECNYPKSFMVWIGLHGVMFLFLFSDFYKTRYTGKNQQKGDGACMVQAQFLDFFIWLIFIYKTIISIFKAELVLKY